MDSEDVGEWIERENCSLYIGEEWINFDAWSHAMTWSKKCVNEYSFKNHYKI